MGKVRLLNGKPLLVGGKVAISDNCCCSQGSCPDPLVNSITANVAGISFPCGCIDLGPFGFAGNSIVATDNAVNGIQILGFVPGPPDTWSTSGVAPFDISSYSDGHCGHFFFSGTVNQSILVACVSGSTTVLIYDSGDLFATFYATGASFGSSVSNQLSCGQIVTDPFPLGYGGPAAVLGVASGGSVTLTQP